MLRGIFYPICSFTVYLEEVTKNLDIGFYLAGTLLVVSGLIGFPLMKIKKWEETMNSKEPYYSYEKEYPMGPLKVNSMKSATGSV